MYRLINQYVKNMEQIIKIKDISSDGRGIGRTEQGRVVFVSGTLPGDTARVEVPEQEPSEKKKGGLEASLISVINYSSDRVELPCSYSSECGGCPLMGLSYPAQLSLKERHVKDALERIGGFKEGKDFTIEDILYTSGHDADRKSVV